MFVHSGRYCPRCTYPLAHSVHPSGIAIDHCRRCGGSFIDYGKASHVVGEKADPAHWPKEAFARPPYPSRIGCPSGHGQMWAYHLAWEGRQVEIDGCGVCHGLWLDAREAHELEAITSVAHAENNRPGASKGTVGVVAMYLVQLATAVPIEVYHPLRRKPVLTRGLVALLTVLFVIEVVVLVQQGRSALEYFALIPSSVEAGRVYQLVSHAFFHGGIAHLLGNLYFLWIFGDNVEDEIGRGRFTLLYLASAVGGGVAYWLGNLHSSGAMLGASGAIAGLMGAYLVLFPKVKLWVVFIFIPLKIRAYWYLFVWIGMQFVIMLDPKSQVAWLAHVGGFVAGVALAFLMRRRQPEAHGLPAAR